MPPVHFKLTKDGHTRRVTFGARPSWTQLAEKLQALYNIPAAKVGVSYVDNDNDEITASSEDELKDYYQVSHQPGSAVKFTVWDLSVPRDGPVAGAPSANRNTFGPDNFEFLDPVEGWQTFNVGAFDGIPSSEGPHAFVEIVTSDASGFESAKEIQDDSITESDSVGGGSTVQQTSYVDKGKERARSSSFGAASITSLLAEEASEKYSIHVLDHSSERQPKIEHGELAEATQIPAQSTPKAAVLEVKAAEEPVADNKDSAEATQEDPSDPPLPSVDSVPTNTSATLSHDVATLLNTFTNIIASHPELSEGVRNIANNVRSGVYWQAHRSALTEAVTEFSRSEDVRRVEEEAARRINDALGAVFRTFATAPANVNSESARNAPNDTAGSFMAPHRAHSGLWNVPWPMHDHDSMHTTPPGGAEPLRPLTPPPPPPPLFNPNTPGSPLIPHPPPPPPHQPNEYPLPPPTGPHFPPPPPPGNERRPGGGPPPHHHGPRFPPYGGLPFGMFHPPPPPPHMHLPPHGPPPHFAGHPFAGPPFAGPPPVRHTNGPPMSSAPPGSSQPAGASAAPMGLYANPFLPPGDVNQTKPSGTLSEQELRDQVEEAKRVYKAQKEAYREYRDERKKEKDSRRAKEDTLKVNVTTSTTVADGPSAETTQIISTGRNGYPPLEIYSVPLPGPGPRRFNTHLGHGSASRGLEKKGEDLNTRAQARIAKRLADMGFSENTFPDLPAKIKAQMPITGAITKEGEDDAVTTLLEELLARSTRSPVASGSRGPLY